MTKRKEGLSKEDIAAVVHLFDKQGMDVDAFVDPEGNTQIHGRRSPYFVPQPNPRTPDPKATPKQQS